MTQEERLVVSAYTGYAMTDFSLIHEYIEKKLGRPVWTHELGEKTVWNELKEIVKPEFLKLCGTN